MTQITIMVWSLIYSQTSWSVKSSVIMLDASKALGTIIMNKASGGDGMPVELIQILKDDDAKLLHSICQQIWKSSGHRAGKSQFPFQCQRKAMPKNVQTTTQLHSFHMLPRSCPKSSKLGFNSMWTENFQIYMVDLEKIEEPEIKLPTSIGS